LIYLGLSDQGIARLPSCDNIKRQSKNVINALNDPNFTSIPPSLTKNFRQDSFLFCDTGSVCLSMYQILYFLLIFCFRLLKVITEYFFFFFFFILRLHVTLGSAYIMKGEVICLIKATDSYAQCYS
jgi:hypothetical protein